MRSCPKSLLEMQRWFANIITRPLQENQRLPPLSPTGKPIDIEAKKRIAPSPSLKPHERIEIYSRQYWWRLIQVLQENFPLVTRLFGYKAFNKQIATPYLDTHPPTHWALCKLGDTLPRWIKKHYTADNQTLVYHCASIDFAAQRAFWSGSFPPLNATNDSNILHSPLKLQPTLSLFAFPYDLFSFREILLKQGIDHYLSVSFPKLKKGKYFFVIYRNETNNVCWNEISIGEHRLLTLLQNGYTVEQACRVLEQEQGDAYKEATTLIPLWFKQWIAFNWLARSDCDTVRCG